MIKICFIGAGWFSGLVHYPSLAEIPDCKIAAIADIDETKARERARQYNVPKVYCDYKTMLSEIRPDAVYAVMAPGLMYPMAMHCLDQGFNLFLEKPPALKSSQLKEMADLAQKRNCRTMVGFNRRFAPVIVEAKKEIENFGPITQVVATYNKNNLAFEPYSRNIPYSILLCDAIHALDFLLWHGGNVVQVHSICKKIHADHYNCFSALIEFENCSAILNVNFSSGNKTELYEIHSAGTSAYIAPPYQAYIRTEKYTKKLETGNLLGIDQKRVNKCFTRDPLLYKLFGYLQENQHFIDCIKNGGEPQTSFQNVLPTLRLVEKIGSYCV